MEEVYQAGKEAEMGWREQRNLNSHGNIPDSPSE